MTAQALPVPPGPRLPRRVQSLAFHLAPQRFIENSRRRYGDVVAFRTVLHPRLVMIFDLELVGRMFASPVEHLRAGEAHAQNAPVIGEHSVLVLDGADHLQRRRLLLSPFRRERVRAHRQVVLDATDRVIDAWPVGRRFELLPSMRHLTLEVIVRSVFGVHHERRKDDLTNRLGAMLDPFRPRRLPIPRAVGSGAARQLVDEIVYDEIAASRGTPDLECRDDVLSRLLIASDQNGQEMTDQELVDHLVTLLVAGHETTSIALAWAFELLLRNPSVLERLKAELANGGDEYLDAVVKETLRLRPPVVHVGRVVRGEAYQLGQYRIPPGTEMRASIAAIHDSSDHYPEPLAFRPERFLGRHLPGTHCWLPFGGGARRCLGASFATFEMAVVIRRVLERANLVSAERRPEKRKLGGRMQLPMRGVRVIRKPGSAHRGGRQGDVADDAGDQTAVAP